MPPREGALSPPPCPPYFTGEQRIVDTAGRVERFRQRYARGKKTAGAETTTA